MSRKADWPIAPTEGWLETAATLQMRSQIVGKPRLALAPPENHWWHVALYLTARGLTTSPVPDGKGGALQIDFDFLDHALVIEAGDGRRETMPLDAKSVEDFYALNRSRRTAAAAGLVPHARVFAGASICM